MQLTRFSSRPCPRHVIVTGASDGIGLRLANLYHASGAHVIALGRRERREIRPKLAKEIRYLALNFTDEDMSELLADLVKSIGWCHLDLLVHCAGVGLAGPVEDHSALELEGLLQINCTAPLLITHCMAPMLEVSHGQVLFIGSTLYKAQNSNFSAYSASKAALHGAAKSLALEWRNKIKVTIIHPGPTSTALHHKVGLDPGFCGTFFAKPADMAREIAAAATGKKTVITLGLPVLVKLWLFDPYRWFGFYKKGLRAL